MSDRQNEEAGKGFHSAENRKAFFAEKDDNGGKAIGSGRMLPSPKREMIRDDPPRKGSRYVSAVDSKGYPAEWKTA
jgi:hypothetical protein